MADIEYPDDLVDLQRRSHAAWEAVETHRKAVDTARRAAPVTLADGSTAPRDWTGEENTEHDRLLDVARTAAEALRARLLGFETPAGFTRYDVVQQLHKAARAGVEA